jgi:GAF domain-containing protein
MSASSLDEHHRVLLSSFAEVGRDLLASSSDPDGALRELPAAALRLVPHPEQASTTRGARGLFQTVGSTSELPRRIDQIQYELASGPCVDAVLKTPLLRTGELREDPRWPEFGRRAWEQGGIRSMLALRLYLEGSDVLAGLNLYSTQPDAFDQDDETVATLLATHGSAALTAALSRREASTLRAALDSNRTIGIAIGIIMSRALVEQDQAFDLLRIASQKSHRKLADIAEEVTRTGTLDLPR